MDRNGAKTYQNESTYNSHFIGHMGRIFFLHNGFFQLSDLSLRFIEPAQRQVMESQRGRVAKT